VAVIYIDRFYRHYDDTQRGHSSEMAQRHYGLTFGMMQNMDGARAVGCLKSSASWQALIDVGQDDLLPIVSSMAIPDKGKGKEVTTQILAPVSSTDIQTLAALLCEQLEAKNKAFLNKIIAQLAAHYFPPQILSTSTSLRQRSRIIVHPSRIQDLRTFLGDSRASFKYPEQAELVELMQARESNILAVLPCAGGKTFMIMFQVCVLYIFRVVNSHLFE
jgi:hypothetical protein